MNAKSILFFIIKSESSLSLIVSFMSVVFFPFQMRMMTVPLYVESNVFLNKIKAQIEDTFQDSEDNTYALSTFEQ